MKKFLLKISLYAVIVFVLLAAGCKSNKVLEELVEPEEVSQIKKNPDAMFWQIDGITDEGETSTVYILGTYHVADERTYPLPFEVDEAWKNADRLCCELSKTDWENFQDAVNKKTFESLTIASGKTLVDELNSKEIALAANFLGEEMIATLVCYEPWVLNSVLSTNLIYLSGLKPEQSLDLTLIYLAGQENRDFDGLDELKVQVDLNAYGDWNTQMIMLRDTLKSLEDSEKAASDINELYEAYLTYDENILADLYFKGVEEDINNHPELESYINDLLYRRNQKWADKIADYLKQPGSTFIFAGAGHFIGDKSVFYYMNQNGSLE